MILSCNAREESDPRRRSLKENDHEVLSKERAIKRHYMGER